MQRIPTSPAPLNSFCSALQQRLIYDSTLTTLDGATRTAISTALSNYLSAYASNTNAIAVYKQQTADFHTAKAAAVTALRQLVKLLP